MRSIVDVFHRKPLPCSFESSLVIFKERVSAVASSAANDARARPEEHSFMYPTGEERPRLILPFVSFECV